MRRTSSPKQQLLPRAETQGWHLVLGRGAKTKGIPWGQSLKHRGKRQPTLTCLPLTGIIPKGREPGTKAVQGHGKSEPNKDAFTTMP